MKRREDGNGAPKKSKMTVMMFQLEGDDATLQEGFKTIGQAMNALIKPANALPPAPREDVLLPPNGGGNGHDVNPEPEAIETEQPAVETSEPTTGRTTARRSRAKPPQIINIDLGIAGGKVSLKDFLSQKGVGEMDSKRCLAIAVWLKENRSINEITGDHVHTCYRHMGWTTPADPLEAIRGLKHSGAFTKGVAPGSYAINHIGENRVMQMDAKP